VAIILIALGIFLLYLGIPASILPPVISGIGFILIGLVWLSPGKGR